MDKQVRHLSIQPKLAADVLPRNGIPRHDPPSRLEARAKIYLDRIAKPVGTTKRVKLALPIVLPRAAAERLVVRALELETSLPQLVGEILEREAG